VSFVAVTLRNVPPSWLLYVHQSFLLFRRAPNNAPQERGKNVVFEGKLHWSFFITKGSSHRHFDTVIQPLLHATQHPSTYNSGDAPASQWAERRLSRHNTTIHSQLYYSVSGILLFGCRLTLTLGKCVPIIVMHHGAVQWLFFSFQSRILRAGLASSPSHHRWCAVLRVSQPPYSHIKEATILATVTMLLMEEWTVMYY